MTIYGSACGLRGSTFTTSAHYTKDPGISGVHQMTRFKFQSGTGIRLSATRCGAHSADAGDAGCCSNLQPCDQLWNWIDPGGCRSELGSDGAYKSGMQVNGTGLVVRSGLPGCAIVHNSSKSDLAPVGNVDDTA